MTDEEISTDATVVPIQASLPEALVITGPARFPESKLFIPPGRWKIPATGNKFSIGDNEEPEWFVGERDEDGWADPHPAFLLPEDDSITFTNVGAVAVHNDGTTLHFGKVQWGVLKDGSKAQLPERSAISGLKDDLSFWDRMDSLPDSYTTWNIEVIDDYGRRGAAVDCRFFKAGDDSWKTP